MTTTGSVVIESLRLDASEVPIENVFVSIDLGADVAYVAYEDESSIKWDQLSRTDAEFMAGLGARTAIHLRPAPQLGRTR